MSQQVLPFFVGARMQRGHGIGQLFRGLARMAMPFWKHTVVPAARRAAAAGAKQLKRTALQTGVRLASDALRGANMKQAAKNRLKEAGVQLVRHAIKRPAGSRGTSSQPATKRRRTSTPAASRGPRRRASKKKKKSRSPDIFDD